jgi:fatty acyl-CoA reductase
MLQYYTTRQWIFKNDNLKALPQSLTGKDRETFYTDTKIVNWNEYIRQIVLGTRQYCLKEDPATLPKARRHMKR